MKAILISIRPQWVAKILNGEKTIEIRKKFPSDYVGWVYIYCTKDKKYANLINRGGFLTGMVVARFWCDKVEEINNRYCRGMLIDSCLTNHELNNYLGNYQGKAIHITKLEIFDKPKEIREFVKCDDKHIRIGNCFIGFGGIPRLTRPPQSWCYVEI